MMESGDSIRGMAIDSGFPLVMLIGYRGWNRHGVITDSAARYTETFLNAMGINYYLLETDDDAPRITQTGTFPPAPAEIEPARPAAPK